MIWDIVMQWGQVRASMLPAIEACCGTHTEDDVLVLLFAGKAKLWVNGSSGCVTDFSILPRMKCLNVFMVGGTLREIVPMRDEIVKYAKEQGCQRITCVARPEWQRIFVPLKSMGELLYMDL